MTKTVYTSVKKELKYVNKYVKYISLYRNPYLQASRSVIITKFLKHMKSTPVENENSHRYLHLATKFIHKFIQITKVLAIKKCINFEALQFKPVKLTQRPLKQQAVLVMQK